jgi:hypothetical protein
MFNLKGDFMSLESARELAGNSQMCITDVLFADDAEFTATYPGNLQFMMRAFDEITMVSDNKCLLRKRK